MRLTSAEYAQYRVKCHKLYKRVDGRCQCCGRVIDNPTRWNFAHVMSGNGRSKKDGLQNFILVCQSLHTWQHGHQKNLEKDLCVRHFIDNYYNGHKHKYFYDKLIAEKNIVFE